MQYWLLKTEGSCYSIDDLARDRTIAWTGIRNYQARNFMRDGMHAGDLALFYHSNGTAHSPTGVYGIARVASAPYPDETQFDRKDMHYDPKAKKEQPIWTSVDIAFVRKFKEPVTLSQIKFDPALKGMMVAQRGSRLSVQPVLEKDFKRITETLAS
jgi:predicted RNA-binding protein with PUA-like domain